MKSILYSVLLLLSVNVFSGYPEDDAERGDAIAQWALGMKFVRGDGVENVFHASVYFRNKILIFKRAPYILIMIILSRR